MNVCRPVHSLSTGYSQSSAFFVFLCVVFKVLFEEPFDPSKRYSERFCFDLILIYFFSLSPFQRTRPWDMSISRSSFLPRKEVIQPHLPIRLPCYDFTPVIGLTLDGCSLSVRSPALGAPNSHGVTGGVYKARERIHRDMLIHDY